MLKKSDRFLKWSKKDGFSHSILLRKESYKY